MASLPNQIKAKLQNVISSPKLKMNNLGLGGVQGQSPIAQNTQKPTQISVNHRDTNNQSQSPVDLNNSRGVFQKLQLKNLPFIPAKAQSPVTYSHSNTTTNHSNLSNIGNLDQGSSILSKISPQRLISGSTNGNKMIIPANQIKLVKKDGTSPSPEARLTSGKQQVSPTNIAFLSQNTNIQNSNPNIGNASIRNSQNKSGKNASQNVVSKHQNHHQQSDDETNVYSDNEERSSNLSFMKHDTSSNNFNRPKLNTLISENQSSTQQHLQQQNSTFTDQTLASQRTQRGSQVQPQINSTATAVNPSESARLKVISQKQIRQSPSPPPNQVLKNDKPPTVTNVQSQINVQKQQHQPITKQTSQLASDFIKGMITQSRSNNNNNNNGFTHSSTQKKLLGSGLTSIKKNQQANSQANFHKDMKKHGIAKDIQEVSQFGQLLSESSPPRIEEINQQNTQQNKQSNIATSTSKLLVTKISHIRNYSPPPNFDQAQPANILGINKDILNNTQKQQQTIAQESSPTNASTINEEQQQTNTNGEASNVFQFPFQRRARSLSLPKQEIIQSKLRNKGGLPLQPGQTDDQKSQSPNRENQEAKRNGPVVAKVNFVLGQKGVMQQQYQEEESIFEKNKEVDEWLMGSGESDNTAASNMSNNNINQNGLLLSGGLGQQMSNNLKNNNNNNNNPNLSQANSKVIETTQNKQKASNENQKKESNNNQNEGDENSVGEEEEEDWMFKTFDKSKAKNNPKTANSNINKTNNNISINKRIEQSSREFNLEEEFGESPFDMAPEMQKQFMMAKPSTKKQNQKDLMLDHIVEDCQDLGQYIDKIDEFMSQFQ